MKEHNRGCACERCLLLDEIMTLAQELSECIVSKLYDEHIEPSYWGKRERQKMLLKRLKELQ